jgi:mono/diheme cytochrome c family protein
MRKLGFFLFVAAAACSSKEHLPRTAQGASVLEVRGAIKGGPHELGRADLEKLPRLKVRGTDPRTGRSAEFEGTSLAVLVSDRVELRRGADTVVVRTSDRTAVPIPLPVIRQLKPVLADRMDGVRITPTEIAWPNTEQRGLATDPRAASWWARDVVALELVDWQRTYGPALAPPEGAQDEARRGAGVYVESCISCHRVRGQGGERGPDLTTVASRIAPQKFAELLPSHPGWNDRRLRDGSEDSIGEVWAFLRGVASVPAPTPASPEEPVTADRATPKPR